MSARNDGSFHNASLVKVPGRQLSEPRAKQAHRDANFSSFLAFALFAAINTIAGLTAPILDCDEVFNYWEPTHYLEHGFGLQTWEYSPDYAIRSWLYIALHAVPGEIASLLTARGPTQFYTIRIVLGLACAYCQTRLCTSIGKVYQKRVAQIFQVIMLSSTGMFYAAVAFLPSSFAMMTAMLGLAAFMDRQKESSTKVGIVWFAVGAIVGWPFSAALVLPLVLDEIMHVRVIGIVRTLHKFLGASVWVLMIAILDIAVNTSCYRKLVFVPWRIVSYNVFSGSSRGPDIFGTEPWHFYARNLLLNFHIWFLLALCSGPLVSLQILLQGRRIAHLSHLRNLILLSPFYLWLAIFTLQAHKEERFMYPAYPFLCLNAAYTSHCILFYVGHADFQRFLGQASAKLKLASSLAGALLVVSVGCLRTIGTVTAYQAPLQIYEPFQQPDFLDIRGNVCFGKEWYRFPSSYFLPKHMRAKFVKSAFDGLLPGQFNESNAGLGPLRPTWIVPTAMNDLNLEDPGKHIKVDQCSFIVDSTMLNTRPTQLEPDYIDDIGKRGVWKRVKCVSFLDTSATSAIPRLFWVPDWAIIPQHLRRKWGTYCLLQREQRV